jgi:bifunctional UDP-N-acetylglucosamine pyrophosphorylase/glucosamine-1-phosphate N-acetyltransferase
MARIVANTAIEAGLDPVIFVVPGESSAIQDALGPEFVYAEQYEQLGTGHALIQAENAARGSDNVVVAMGDTPLIRSETLRALTTAHVRAETPATIVTSKPANANGLGRVLKDSNGRVRAIVEQGQADAKTLSIDEVNTGLHCYQSAWLWENLAKLPPSTTGEVYLTDLIELAFKQGHQVETVTLDDGDEGIGVNTRVDLSFAESALRARIRRYWMLEGVTMPDPSSVYIDYGSQLGMDTVVHPNTHIKGSTTIGEHCEIGPNSIIVDSSIGDGSIVVASMVEGAVLESDVSVGPMSHIRHGTYLESGVRVGNFGEIKNSRVGRGTRSGHFSYIGDAEVGSNVNVGAGSITCNYDGETKHRTVIGDDVFIGCDTMMVAPVKIGDRSYTGTGSVVNKDVPPDSGAIGAPARIRTKRPDAKQS